MKANAYYPISVCLQNQHALLVGFGEVGKRKLSSILSHGIGSVLILDPHVSTGVKMPGHNNKITFASREWREGDIARSFIVFAATNSPDVNAAIARCCKKQNKLCNCATNPENGNFILPAIAKNGDLTLAISTNGKTPALARRLKKDLEIWLEPHKRLAWLLGRIRKTILEQSNDSNRNADIFRNLAFSDLGDWLMKGEMEKSKLWMETILPDSIKIDLDSILSEYCHVFS